MGIVTIVMIKSFIVNLLLSILKLITGFISKSYALIGDGVHSFSDLITDIIAIIGSKLSNIPADEKHPYGHGKLEYVTSLIIGAIICILGITLINNAFNNKYESIEYIVIIVSIFTIIIKFILSRYILKKGISLNNNILIASGKESSMDVISSIVVVISSFLMLLGKYNKIFLFSDMIAAIIIGLFIIRTGFKILMENLSIILEEQETNKEYIDNIKKIILKNKYIKNIDKLVLLKFGSYYKLICEVSMNPNISVLKAHNQLDEIENRLSEFDNKIKYKTIHVNPYKKEKNL